MMAKKKVNPAVFGGKGKVYRGDGAEEEEQKMEIGKRELEEYYPQVKRTTQFFSLYDADSLLSTLADFAEVKCSDFKIAQDKYKMKLNYVQVPMSEDDEEWKVEIGARIMQAPAGKCCVEFSRKSGDQQNFTDLYFVLREHFGDMINATD